MVPGVATLDRSPDQSPGVRPISPSTRTEGNQEGWPSWVEYRSGGTGGPHPGVDIQFSWTHLQGLNLTVDVNELKP